MPSPHSFNHHKSIHMKLTEQIIPLFESDGLRAIMETPVLYRFRYAGADDRFYFREGSNDFYYSVTSWTRAVLGKAKGLDMWEKLHGAAKAAEMSFIAREYGTLLHTVVAMHERHEKGFSYEFQSAEIAGYIMEYMTAQKVPAFYFEMYYSQLENDMLGYFRWKKQYNVRVIAVEYPVWDDTYKIASLVDLVVEHDLWLKKDGTPYASTPKKPAQTLRTVSLVDLKSGDKSAAYDSYKLQGRFYLHAWNERFAGTQYQAGQFYNLHPKDRKRSHGQFHFHTNDWKHDDLFWNYMEQNVVAGYHKPKSSVKTVTGGEDDFQVVSASPQEWLANYFETIKIA